jgi:hypothetical protein
MNSTVTQPTLLELAKQGNAKAIATLMNHLLQPKGITAKAIVKDSCLEVMLESVQEPNQEALVKFIRKGLTSLEVASIQQVRVYGQQTGQEILAWQQDFELKVQVDSIPISSSISPNPSSQQKQQPALSVNTNQSTVSASNKKIIKNPINSNKKNKAKSINTLLPWHKTNFGIITLLIICWPCGIYQMWKHGKWSNKVKWSVTATLASLFVVASTNNQQESTSMQSKSQETLPTSVSPSSTDTEGKDQRFIFALESTISTPTKESIKEIPNSTKIATAKSVCKSFSQGVNFEDFAELIIQKYGTSSSSIELGGALIGAGVSVYCPEYLYKLPQ